VVVNDVTADPRYLTAFASALSEAVVPVVDPGTGAVVGMLDTVEQHDRTEELRRCQHRIEAALAPGRQGSRRLRSAGEGELGGQPDEHRPAGEVETARRAGPAYQHAA
jgi:hypothetical protein